MRSSGRYFSKSSCGSAFDFNHTKSLLAAPILLHLFIYRKERLSGVLEGLCSEPDVSRVKCQFSGRNILKPIRQSMYIVSGTWLCGNTILAIIAYQITLAIYR